MGRQDLLAEIHDRQKNIVLLNSQINDLTIEKDLESVDPNYTKMLLQRCMD